MRTNKFPKDWDEEKVKRVIAPYETQTKEEAAAEDEAAYGETDYTIVQIPVELVTVVRDIIADYQATRKIKKSTDSF